MRRSEHAYNRKKEELKWNDLCNQLGHRTRVWLVLRSSRQKMEPYYFTLVLLMAIFTAASMRTGNLACRRKAVEHRMAKYSISLF
jgi:hypothetical protein